MRSPSERGTHQRAVTALVDVGTVFEHPRRDGQPRRAGGSQGTRHSATHVSGPSLP